MPVIEPGSELDAVLDWAVENYPHPIIDALRERDALVARVAELEAGLVEIASNDWFSGRSLAKMAKNLLPPGTKIPVSIPSNR